MGFRHGWLGTAAAVVVAVSTVAVVSGVAAQGLGGRGGPPYEAVEEGAEDASPLAASLQVIDPGLAVPSGFTSVYRVPGRSDLYMRVDGAIHAVFPKSSYVSGQEGLIAIIPEDTVYFVGRPTVQALTAAFGPPLPPPAPPLTDAQRDRLMAGRERLDGRSDVRRSPVLGSWRTRIDVGHERISPRHAGPPIVADPAYRRSRIADLLQAAVRAERGE